MEVFTMLEEVLLEGLKPAIVEMVNDYLSKNDVALRKVQIVINDTVKHEVLSGLIL